MAKSRADLHPTSCLDWSEEPAEVRAAYDRWLEQHPMPPVPRVVPARAYRPRGTR